MKRLIVGMGASGLSLARHWSRAGFAVDAIDDRAAPPLAQKFAAALPAVTCYCGEDFRRWRAANYADYEKIGVSPGVSPAAVAAPAGKLTSETALFADMWRRRRPAATKLLAITGTNGKSTAAALTAHICAAGGMRSAAVGNIGKPLLDALAEWRAGGFPHAAAVELSSFQLELAADFVSDAAVILNIGADHLDRHGARAPYAEVKARIYRRCGRAVVNRAVAGAWPAVCAAAARAPRRLFISPDGDGNGWKLTAQSVIAGGESYALRDMSPACRAQPFSVLAALALAADLALPRRQVAAALASFAGLPHRRQVVAEIGGARYVNDSKATNVDAALHALAAADGAVVLIAGGDGKGQDFAPLAAAAGKIRRAVLIGRDAPALRAVLAGAGAECVDAGDMDEAVARAKAAARAGDTVLLSPACASLDQFRDYAARGDAFARAARALGGGA